MIFVLAALSVVVTTFRLLMVVRGYKMISTVLISVHALLFIFVLGSVFRDLDNFWNVFAYAAGVGSGNVLGIFLEGKLAIGYAEVRIISTDNSSQLAESLRDHGYGATETSGYGRKGPVKVTVCIVRRRDVPRVEDLVLRSDPQCFITVEEAIRPLRKRLWPV
jgi:uncharacterized protein YebE (UPF0316 family)